jgi:hypothetical protein
VSLELTAVIDQEKMIALFRVGERYVNLMSQVVDESELRHQRTDVLCIASLMYCVGLAKLSKLNAEGFISLAIHAFAQVTVDPKTKEEKKKVHAAACSLCGHSFLNNLHGFDQNDAHMEPDGTLVHSGRCTYCRECNPRPGKPDAEPS